MEEEESQGVETAPDKKLRIGAVSDCDASLIYASARSFEQTLVITGVFFCSVCTFAASASDYLLLGVLLSSIGTACSHIAGKLIFPCYELFMPFCGGTVFVLLQAQGYTIVSLANIAAFALYWGDYDHGFMFRCALGFSQVCAMWTTTQALFFFRGRSLRMSESEVSPRMSNKHQQRIKKKTPIIIAIVVLGVALYLKGHFVSGGVLSILSVTYCIVLPYMDDVRGWKIWQPMEGGRAFVLLQSQGWLMLSLLLNVILTIKHHGADDVPGLGIVSSFLHTGAIGCLAVSVVWFDSQKREEEPKHERRYMGWFGIFMFLICY